MANTRKAKVRKAPQRTGTAKAKVKDVVRKANESLDVAAHNAERALSRSTGKLKGAAQDIGTNLDQVKVSAETRARRVERNVVSALQGASELITGAVRSAKRQLAAATKKTID